MIIDSSGILLTPGNLGKDCLGNGTHDDIECCCDECDYMLCCLESHDPKACRNCRDLYCPHSLQSIVHL